MRQGDVRRWRVRSLHGFDRIFQNISNNYIQKKYFKQLHSEEDGRSSVSGSDSLSLSEAPFSLAIFFSILRCNLSGGVSTISWDMEACFFLLFLPRSPIHFHGQAFNLDVFCLISGSLVAMFCFHFWVSPQSREIGPKESCCSQN